MIDVFDAVLSELRRGRAVVMATVIRASGSTPRGATAKMAFLADGGSVGTIGGGAFEAMVAADAGDLHSAGDETGSLRKSYSFTEHGENALGMACGGSAEVFLERLEPGTPLVIFGAGHVGLALAGLAATVGFLPMLVDDRAEACGDAESQGVGRVFRCSADYREGVPTIDDRTCVAVVTRCHRTDRLALQSCIDRDPRYLGLIGSRRKRRVIFDELRGHGIDEERLSRVRCPIGLPLGGDRPEEIAVSIVAELLQLRNG